MVTPRPHRVSVYFSASELAAVRARATACTRTTARYVRESALGAIPRARQRQRTDDLALALIRLCQRLESDARLSSSADAAAACAELRTALVRILRPGSR